MKYEIIKYEYFWNYCEQAVPAIVLSITIVIALKLVFNLAVFFGSRSAKKAYKKGFEDGSKHP